MEIEKKFLLEQIPFPLAGFPCSRMRQCYISTDPVIRLRQCDDAYVLTVKGRSHDPMVRQEFELPLTERQFAALLAKNETNIVAKTRYYIPLAGGLTAELDVYEDALAGLLTVEVEFASVATARNFVPPDWFGPDVTADGAYHNSALARYGLPTRG